MKQWKNNPTRALIDCSAFHHNISLIKNEYPDASIILPVKANAYGHGDCIIAREAEKAGVAYLAIARINEGIHLREEGITLPLINLGVEFGPNIELAINHDIDLTISSLQNAEEIASVAAAMGVKIPVHLKIDTGMLRLGCRCDEAIRIARYIDADDNLIIHSIYSHFACSDDDSSVTQEQISLFGEVIAAIRESGIIPKFYHFYNSGAIIQSPVTEADWYIRPGIMVFGYPPSQLRDKWELKPVLSLHSRVILVKRVPKGTGIGYGHIFSTEKDTFIATIPVGYGDGFFRNLSGKIDVTINGKNYPQRGRISMDLIMVEVDEKVKAGDEVILFGNRELYKCGHDAATLASIAGTISYEIITALSERVERIAINRQPKE